jgi:hypothetical protein
MSTRLEVAQFLRDFKAALSLGHVRWLERSAKGKSQLSGLDIHRNEAIEILHGLTPDNYCQGPMPDDFQPEQCVWVFGCEVRGIDAYLKLKLQPDPRRRNVVHAVIWAFHVAEYPLRFPLKGSK